MHPKGLYEPELVKRWRERLRRFELSELLRGRGPQGAQEAGRRQGPHRQGEGSGQDLVDAYPKVRAERSFPSVAVAGPRSVFAAT